MCCNWYWCLFFVLILNSWEIKSQDDDDDDSTAPAAKLGGGTCYSAHRNIYFPKETQLCCEKLNFACKYTTNADVWCVIDNDKDLQEFGDCCRSKGGGKHKEVSNIPDAPECVSKLDEVISIVLAEDLKG